MKKVLLAVDGITPDQKAFRYAIELCNRIKAELNVFQIIDPRNYGEYLKKMRKGAGHARRYLESSLVAATFAEAGEHETAAEIMSEALKNIKQLLPESEKEGVPCHFTITSGAPDTEIINYVNAHRDVVLTIYDSPGKGRRQKGLAVKETPMFRKIKQSLFIPLVVMCG
ncbi:MAG: universal stress protein [Desulfobacterales bacterium]|uniref:Universal stress protein n=1 Tax=Candidatus Desulfatibia profunda TaxID=2841695 RepID=A0A8J6NVN6_9BACT|nr:universal stress protein [Candidatus Desulfatibia profunda]MBL7178590.1 universal stress protein [Desulfobacterales bacterium]